MTNEPTPTTGPSRSLDASALKALSHPLRLEIYDILSQYGPQTASSLAERVGESSGVTSYHLRALAKHDLIREVADQGTARERWWERPRGSVSMGSTEARKTPAGKLASAIVVEEFYQLRHQQLLNYLRETANDEAADDLTALLTTSTVSLTDAQFEDFAQQIEAVISQFVTTYRDQRGPGVRRYNVRADVFPISEPEPGAGS